MMTTKGLLADLKSDTEVIVKQLSAGEAVDVVSFNASEKDAIKDTIMDAEISKYTIEVDRQLPANAKIVVCLKQV